MSAIAAAVIVGVGAVAGGVMAYQGAKAQGNAAKQAAEIQSKYGLQAIDAETARFLEMKDLMQPYADAGYGSLKTQQDMIGQNGADAQQASINQITNGPLFGSLTKQGKLHCCKTRLQLEVFEGEMLRRLFLSLGRIF